MGSASSRPRSALRCLAPLLLVLLLPTGLVDSHELHGGGPGAATIYPDARHAGQADHWEAAGSVEVRRCPDCLAPAKHRGPAPALLAGAPAPASRGQAVATLGEPARPAFRRPGGPRAPPLS